MNERSTRRMREMLLFGFSLRLGQQRELFRAATGVEIPDISRCGRCNGAGTEADKRPCSQCHAHGYLHQGEPFSVREFLEAPMTATATSIADPDRFAIFDTLPRLWASGHVTREQDGAWYLFSPDGEKIASGRDFRDLCVNIVLAAI